MHQNYKFNPVNYLEYPLRIGLKTWIEENFFN